MDKAMSARTRYGPSGLRDAGSSRRYFGGPPTAPLERFVDIVSLGFVCFPAAACIPARSDFLAVPCCGAHYQELYRPSYPSLSCRKMAKTRDCFVIKKFYLGTTRKKTLWQYYIYCSKKDDSMLVVKIETRLQC